mgnify:CR=1 FL=1
MTKAQQETIDFVDECLRVLPDVVGEKVAKTCEGLVNVDISDCGIPAWFDVPVLDIVKSYAQITDEVTSGFLDDYSFVKQQEELLEYLKIGQSYEIETIDAMEAFKTGMMDIWEALIQYLLLRDRAELFYLEFDEEL